MENSEDRKERGLLENLDPFVVLKYITSSIDIIIELKFEDIENKISKAKDAFHHVKVKSFGS